MNDQPPEGFGAGVFLRGCALHRYPQDSTPGALRIDRLDGTAEWFAVDRRNLLLLSRLAAKLAEELQPLQ